MAEPMKSLATRTPRTILPTERFVSHSGCPVGIGRELTLVFDYNVFLANGYLERRVLDILDFREKKRLYLSFWSKFRLAGELYVQRHFKSYSGREPKKKQRHINFLSKLGEANIPFISWV